MSEPQSASERSAALRPLLALALAFVLAACGDDGPSREEAMSAVATEVGVPSFEGVSANNGEVASAVDAACAAPDARTLGDAVEAIDAARRSWLRSQAVWMGPAMERRSAGRIDWVVDSAGIEELVAGAEELTPELVAEAVGSDNRGLRSLRSVLTRDDAADLLADQRWCAYLTSTAAVVAAEGRALFEEWRSFSAELTGDEVNDWLAMLVNDAVQTVKATTTEPSTEGDAPVEDPAVDRVAQLQGVAAVMTRLGPLLCDELDQRLQDALAEAMGGYESGDVEQGRARAKEVERLLTADVAGKLGVTIGFSDADGDGSG
ncbi:hypothetical protein BH18ACT2_BH18ACT2_17390 [soil metagenome]